MCELALCCQYFSPNGSGDEKQTKYLILKDKEPEICPIMRTEREIFEFDGRDDITYENILKLAPQKMKSLNMYAYQIS